MADGGKMPVIEGEGVTIPRQNLDSLNVLALSQAVRPSLSSQHSSSLPSTPYAHARKLSDDFRTPSPTMKGGDVSSPRSARSESDSTIRPTARAPFLAGCKYETGMAFSRRRIPYSLGGEILDHVPNVKNHLDPAEEKKLSGDMRELYERILPSVDSDKRRAKFVGKLEKILNLRWPGSDIKVHVFGSSGNLLCSNDSDVDICITTSMKALERVCLLAKALAEHGMERVVCVPHAKVPIVKMWDPELELACDMNVNNTLALENTRMIRTYVQVDPRVRPLAMVIKHWSRRRILNDAALGGTLSSYTWICLIINFLQTRSPRILPSLQSKPHERKLSADAPFNDDVESLRGFGNANTESIGELLFHFFRRYGHELDFEKNVISIREGALISKTAKKWHLMQNNRLCVEEPFNTQRNLGNTADDTSFRGVHLELRRAFELVSQAKLEQCCEEYIFPPQEEKVWIKPPQQRRAVLTRSLSQQARGAGKGNSGNASGTRGGNNKNRSGASNRRASSAAAMNKMPPFAAGQPGTSGQANERMSGNQIHDQLFHHYQLLQAQEAHLRLQMHQRAQANLHAQVTANMQPLQAPAPGYLQQSGFDIRRRLSAVEQGPLSTPLRSVQALYYPIQMGQPQMQRMPHSVPMQQSSTNPPSPSLPVAQPAVNGELRRGPQRSITSDNNFVTTRSHSQPPSNSNMRVSGRPGINVSMMPLNPNTHVQQMALSTLQQYQQAYLRTKPTVELPPSQNMPQIFQAESPRLRSFMVDHPDDSPAPRYVGYYVDQSPLLPLRDSDGLLPPIPTYNDLTERTRRGSTSPSLSRLRSHTSRSPSPTYSNGSRDLLNGYHSSSSQPASFTPRREQSELSNSQHGQAIVNGLSLRSGPVIVDGSSDASDYVEPLEPLFPVVPIEGPTTVENRSANSQPDSSTLPCSEGFPGSLSTQHEIGHGIARSSPNVLQFGDFPARATIRANRSPKREGRSNTDKNSPQPLQPTFLERLEPLATANAISSPTLAEAPPAITSGALSLENADSSGSKQEGFANPANLLFPVREVLTPSPTVKRTSNNLRRGLQTTPRKHAASLGGGPVLPAPAHSSSPEGKGKGKSVETSSVHATGKFSNGIGLDPLSDHHHHHHHHPQQQQHSRTASQKISSFAPTQIQPQALPSGWQQPVNKKARKSRKSNSVGSAAIQVNEVERKGG